MQTGRPTLIEGAPCIPREEIQAIHLDPNDNRLPLESAGAQVQTQCYNQINTCGSGDLTAPSACCRISFEAGWLVCDAFNAFDHMACVCNDNTVESPTREPTTQAPTIPPPPTLEPTKEPTPIVTSQPTSEPTNEPTNGPTNEPTKGPTNPPTVATESPTTKEPTNEPTAAPIVSTESPTNAPTKVPTNDPTKSPTSSPTMAPTISPAPTPQPTISKYFTTENKFDNDLDATIRQSQCKEDPPVIEFLQGSSFVYRYEVTVEEGAAVENVAGLWTNQLHDELSREFMVCGSDGGEAFQYDSIWILQSKPHEIKYGLQCGTTLETPSSQEGIAIERAKDDEANESNSNDGTDQNCFVVEAEAKIIAYQSPIGKKKKQLWSDTDYESGAVADRFANDAIDFLSSVMSDGKGKLLEDDGLVVGVSFQGGEIVAADVEEQNGDAGTDQQEEDTSENNAIDNNGTANTPGSDPWTDNFVNPPENIAVGIEGPGSPNDNPNQKGLTPPIIATIAVVASVAVLIILMGVSRRRRQNKEPKEDEEYLRDIETNQSGSLHYAMGAVHHLDLSDSDDGDMNEPGPIVRSELDLEDRHTGDGNEPTNHFFNLSNVARSPSSRQRSQMGPLRATDEFLEGKSAATTPKGNHRGGGTPKSSSKAPPPSFVTSPRTYALRDTIKL